MILIPLFTGCIEDENQINRIPEVLIIYPTNNQYVSSIIKITGTSFDKDGDNKISLVEIRINGSDWVGVEGTDKWSYDWNTYTYSEGKTTIYARSWDGIDYSEIYEVIVYIKIPKHLSQMNINGQYSCLLAIILLTMIVNLVMVD